MPELDLATFAILAVAAFAAGWLDAIGGGGGLIQLPALLLALPVQATTIAIGTNKLSSIIGTSAASVAFAKSIRSSPHSRGASLSVFMTERLDQELASFY